MRNYFLFFTLAIATSANLFAQVDVDKSINLSGLGTNAKITGIKDVSDPKDAVSVESLQKGGFIYGGTSTFTANVYNITVSPALTPPYLEGMAFTFKADAPNTGAASVKVGALPSVLIKKNISSDLSANDIITGQVVTVVYDGVFFQLSSRTNQTYLTGNQNITLSGDVTGSGATAISTAIAADAVNSSKIADNSITDADINSAAAIMRGKLANGTANQVVINDGTGVLSSEAQLALSRGGTNNNSYTSTKFIAYDGSKLASTAYDQSSFAAAASIDGTTNFVSKFTSGTSIGNSSIFDDGNVGINTNAPVGKLDIAGGADNTGANDQFDIALQYRAGGYRHFIRSRHNSDVSLGGNDIDFFVNNSTAAAGSSATGTGNIHVMTIESYTGAPRVGIGTQNPNATLTVGSAVTNNLNPVVSANVTGNKPIFVGETTGSKGIMFGYGGNDIQGRSGASFANNTDLILNPYGGSVGVGTATPASKLEVLTTAVDNLWLSSGTNATTDYRLTAGASTSGYAYIFGSRRDGAADAPLLLGGYPGNPAFGRVGIATTTPFAKLDIAGGADSNGNGDGVDLALQYAGLGYRHYIRSRHNSALSAGGNDIDFFVNNSGSGNGSSAPGTGNVLVATMESYAGTARMGVGISAPGYTLDVNGSFRTLGGSLTLLGDYMYVSPANANTFNCGYSSNGLCDLWINYRGYADGFTQPRNFNIGNGQGGNIAWFDGTTNRMSVNSGQTAAYTLDIGGQLHAVSNTPASGYTTLSALIEQTNSGINPGLGLRNTNSGGGGVVFGSGVSGVNIGVVGSPGTFAPVFASAFTLSSDISVKKDVEYLNKEDFETCLHQIREIQSIRYRYKTESATPQDNMVYRPSLHIGVVAQSLPVEVSSVMDASPVGGGEKILGLSLGDLSGLTLAGLKAVDDKQQNLETGIKTQQQQIEQLQRENAILKAESVERNEQMKKVLDEINVLKDMVRNKPEMQSK